LQFGRTSAIIALVAMPRSTLVLLLFVAAVAVGCGPTHAELCERAALCGAGGDAEIDACITDLDQRAAVADIYDCEDQWNSYLDCMGELGACDGDELRGCDATRDATERCIDDRETGRARVRLVTP
jgi:hypothetical protein